MTALLAWVWQGAALACTTALLLRLLPRIGAATRHTAWWLTLAAVLVVPVVSLLPGSGTAGPAVTNLAPSAIVLPHPPDWLLAIVLGAWLGGVLLGAARIAQAVRQLRRLRRSSRPLPAGLEARLSRQVCSGSRSVAVRVSDELNGAAALGFGRPLILVAPRLVDELRDDEIEQLVAHEYAHLVRRDDWMRLVQLAIQTVAGLHPAVWLISRQIDFEREAACDDWVVSRTGDALTYAACLAQVATVMAAVRTCGEAPLLPGLLRAPSTLRARVARLLDERRGRAARAVPSMTGMTALALGAVVLIVGQVSPLVVVGEVRSAGAEVARALAQPALALAAPPALRAERSGPAMPTRREPRPAADVSSDREAPIRMPHAPPSFDRSPVVSGTAAEEPAMLQAPLASVPLETVDAPAAPSGRLVAAATTSDSGSSGVWTRPAHAGLAIGAAASRAGLVTAAAGRTGGRSIAGWFSRAGKSAADRF